MKQLIFILFLSAVTFTINAVERTYLGKFELTADSTKLISIDSLAQSFTIEVRAALKRNDETAGASRQKWGILWNYESKLNHSYALLQCANSNYRDFDDIRYAQIIIGRVTNGIDSVLSIVRLDKDINTDRGENSILLEVNQNETNVYAGSKKYNFAGKINSVTLKSHRCGIYSNEDLHIRAFSIESLSNPIIAVSTNWTKSTLDNYLSTSTDSIEGYWTYLDRNVDTQKARIGGKYSLAIIKADDIYQIIYIDGAVTNSSRWKTGMLKGELRPTIFKNHYDLLWYDSMIEPISSDIYAEIDQNAILSLNFPLYKSSIRFMKIIDR